MDAHAPAKGERPTLKTIAFMTGLGITTVSRALKDAPEIGEETRRRVQMVAREVGYRPNRAGVRLRTGKTNVISLVLNTDEHVGGFVSDVIYGISEVLANTPYHLIVTPYSGNNDPMEPVRYVIETGSADGIIISRTEPDDPRVRFMGERHFPFATHGRTSANPNHPFHDYDNAAFARQAVETLTGLGRRRLSLLAPSPKLAYYHHTRDGFLDGLNGGEADEVAFPNVTTDTPMPVLRAETRKLMERRNRPDGLVSAAGAATLALVAGIEDAGLVVGRDVDLVSKESTPILKLFRSAIHVVREDFRHAGRELTRAVLGAINGAPLPTLQTLAQPKAD
ncbi:MAG: LacI family DNA-binding transcriptional regulator [Methylobacterium mesophilicum]|nr:LacI family DNA-binding transcriptional regulator [Methylobacterium mesophilicum]